MNNDRIVPPRLLPMDNELVHCNKRCSYGTGRPRQHDTHYLFEETDKNECSKPHKNGWARSPAGYPGCDELNSMQMIYTKMVSVQHLLLLLLLSDLLKPATAGRVNLLNFWTFHYAAGTYLESS